MQRGEQDLVLGNVDGELVVGHLQRDHPAEPLPDLVRLPDPAAEHRRCVVDSEIPLEQPLPQCLREIHTWIQVHPVVAPVRRVAGVTHHEDQPLNVELGLHDHL